MHNYGAGPFVAAAVTDMLTRNRIAHIPVGTGNTERYVAGIRNMGATAIMATPSFALYLIDWLEERGIAPRSLGIERMAVAGEPGGGDPVIRERIETAFGCRASEAMGIGDVSITLWGECEDQGGMHFSGRDFVHVELIDPDSGAGPAVRGRRARANWSTPRCGARRCRCCASAAATMLRSIHGPAPAAGPACACAASGGPTTC